MLRGVSNYFNLRLIKIVFEKPWTGTYDIRSIRLKLNADYNLPKSYVIRLLLTNIYHFIKSRIILKCRTQMYQNKNAKPFLIDGQHREFWSSQAIAVWTYWFVAIVCWNTFSKKPLLHWTHSPTLKVKRSMCRSYG